MRTWLYRISLVYLLPCIFIGSLAAQPKEVKKKIQAIKENPAYKYGEATGTTLNVAYQNALENLLESVYVFVSSGFTQTGTQQIIKDKTIYNEQLYSSLSTYSIGTLQDVGRIEYGKEPEITVFVYTTEQSVKQMFDARLTKIRGLIKNGLRNEEKFRIADALRYYTWGLCLLQTLPLGDTATFSYEGSDEVAKLWLHARINTLLADTDIKVTDVEETNEIGVKTRVYLQMAYHDQLVDNFAFSFYNGMRSIGPIHASDGRAVAEFSDGLDDDKLEIKIEYLFESQAKTLDQEMASVLKSIDLPKFSMAVKTVPIKEKNTLKSPSKRKRKAEAERQTMNLQTSDQAHMTLQSLEENRVELTEVTNPQPYIEAMNKLAGYIKSKDYDSAKVLFTETGYEMFEKLVHNGNVTLLEVPQTYQTVQYGSIVVCRKLSMQFKFRNNRQFVNDVVFRFQADTKKIESLALSLTRRTENDILTADKKWDKDWRMDIISFLEDYQTAYALMRLDYLESVFSDDALIVTGVILKHRAGSENVGSIIPGATAEEVKYTKYTKEEFIEKLRYSFNSKEYINLRFNDLEVVKGSGTRDGIFAMQISQDYYSNNYGDSGYLTLLVDLREEFPVIKVRVWQQQKDKEFTARALLNK